MRFLFDALGSTIALTDNNGTIQTQYSYEPFGNVTASGTPSTNPYQFAFHQNDGTGLYYYSARYYSPSLQRFISEDPSGMEGGLNLYAYAGDSPVTLEDPTGLKPGGGNGSCGPCQAFLRYHPAAIHEWWNPINHTYWETDSGDQRFDSGEPVLHSGVPFVSLDHEKNFEHDDASGFISWSTPLSTEVCPNVHDLRRAADLWPNGTVPYLIFHGPNSNTFAHFLANISFPEAVPPSWAPGWNVGW